MKKIIALLLVTLFMFGIVACGNQPAEQPQAPTQDAPAADAPAADADADAPAAPAEGAPDVSTMEAWGAHIRSLYEGETINILIGANPAQVAYSAIADQFTELTGVNVNMRVITDGTVIALALTEHAAGAGNYDIFAVDAASFPEFAGKRVIEPIAPWLNDPVQTPPWFDYEDILTVYRYGISRSQGIAYGIPYSGETRFLGYRTDLFEEHGMTPPTTMEEMLEAARFFNGLEPGLFGVSMRAASGRQGGSGFLSIAYAFSDGPFVNAVTFEPEFDSPDTVAALQFFVDLLQYAPPDVSTFSHEEALSAFMQGSTAMWLDSTALSGPIVDPAQSTIYDRVGFVPTPDGPKGASAALAGWSLTIPTTAPQQDLSWAFIMWINSREMARTYVDAGGVPVRYSIFTDPELVAENWVFPYILVGMESAQHLMDVRGIPYNPDFTYANDMMAIAGTFMNLALIGDLTVEEAARRGQLEMVEFLADRE